jgi:hypothetical protein
MTQEPKREDVSLPSPEDGNDPISETAFLVFRIPDDGQVQKASDSERFNLLLLLKAQSRS